MRLSPRPSADPFRWPNHRSYRARLVITIVAAVMLGSLFTVTAVMKSRGWKPKGSSAQMLASKVDVEPPNSPSPQEQARPDRPVPDVVQVVGPVRQDHKLRNLPYIAPKAESEERVLTRYPRGTGETEAPARSGISGLPQAPTPLERLLGPAPTMPSPLLTFDGINVTVSGCSCAPSDSDGDVGPNHYVEAVNTAFKVFDKSGNTLAGPTTYNSLFAPLVGTPCSGQNNGDPYALYDPIADRWLISDFAFPSFPGTSFWQCIAVSQTPDPAGAYFLYALQVDAANPTYLGDYPKFGFWNNPQPGGAYFLTMNLFSSPTTFIGVRAFAFDRASMLGGGPAHAIAFTILPAGLGDSYSLVAATFRTGSPPPAGRDEFLLAIDSPASENTALTQVKGWKFHVDFGTPANSTLGAGASHSPDALMTVSPFVEAWTNARSSTIVPQQGTSQLIDSLGDRIMTPVVYQNRSGTESLWADSTGILNFPSGPSVVRWYQFDVTGANFPATPVQQQDWSNGNDGLWRFMPSIAVDQNGNAAIGYSTSSSTTFPGIRYAGRLATDPLNNFGQGEGIMFSGTGSETDSDGRWGDYSMTTVDPADGLSFWHVNEYEAATGSFNWHTRIGKFNFVGLHVNVSGTKTVSGTFTPGSAVTYTVALTNSGTGAQNDNPGNEFTDVLPASLTLVSATATSGTSVATIATNTVTWDGAIAPSGSVTITITATIKPGTGGTTVSNQGSINYDADFNGTNEATTVTDDPSVAGSSDPTRFVVTKLNQTITFGALANKTFGDPDFMVSATASSGLPVSFSASGQCTVTSPSPGTVHLTGGGSCTITASQAGDATYNAAPDIQQGFNIGKANQTITFGQLSTKKFGDADFSVSATASSGLAVSFTATGNCSVAGNTVHITGAGSCTITASQAGDANYNAAPPVARSFDIDKADQTVSLLPQNLPSRTFGDPDFNVTGGASSDLPVTFSATGNCTVTPGGAPNTATVHLTGAGSCTLTATQAGNANYNPATGSQTFQINKANQTITFGPLASKTFGDADFNVSATASSGLTVSFTATGNCTIAGNTVHLTSAGSCTITASQAGDSNYNAAPTVPQSFTIAKANQTITFGALANKTFGDADFNVSATASSGLPVSFTATGNCTIAGNTVHLTSAGSCTITASQAGDSNYNAAPNVPQSFTIAKANQTITFGALANKTFGDADFNVSATASSGLSVSFTATGNCSITGNTVHLTGAGSCTITASQAGNANFNAAPDVPQSFTIAKAGTTTSLTSSTNPSALGQSVTFTATVNPAPNTTTPTGTVQFKDGGVNLGAAVSLNASGVATLTTSALTAGTHAITAEYSGNTNFNPSTGSLSQVVGNRALLKFSQSGYHVGEDGKFITITVNRSGDLTTAVTVDYASPDDSSSMTFLPCSTVIGIASSRCDFTTAIGTLRFASGETSKTFDVLISQDTYVEGPETFPLTLSNPTSGAAFAQPADALCLVTIDDDDSGGVVGDLGITESNPIDDNQNFVRQHYHDFLNREPDAAGLSFWTSQITNCGVNQACIDAAKVSVSASFFLSTEFQQTGYYVERTYKSGFGDIAPPAIPVPVRFIDFLRDTQEVGRGIIVGQGQWQAQLDANKRAFALAFVQRPDFTARYPAITSATAFVTLLNTNAGNVLTPAEQTALIVQLSPSPADATLRANVLFQIAENQKLQQQESNRAFVLMEYFGYLRRNPDAAPDSDFTGFNFWLAKLNQFNGDFVKAEMVKGFLTSLEYRGRFGP